MQKAACNIYPFRRATKRASRLSYNSGLRKVSIKWLGIPIPLVLIHNFVSILSACFLKSLRPFSCYLLVPILRLYSHFPFLFSWLESAPVPFHP